MPETFELTPFRPELREILRRVDDACAAQSIDVQAYLWQLFWRGNEIANRGGHEHAR